MLHQKRSLSELLLRFCYLTFDSPRNTFINYNFFNLAARNLLQDAMIVLPMIILVKQQGQQGINVALIFNY